MLIHHPVVVAVFMLIISPILSGCAADMTPRLPVAENIVVCAVIYGGLEQINQEDGGNPYKERIYRHRFQVLAAEATRQFGAEIAQAKMQDYANALGAEFERVGYYLRLPLGLDQCEEEFKELFAGQK